MERNESVKQKASVLVERLLKAPVESLQKPAPIQEAWSEADIIHAIVGAAGGDMAKLRDGLTVLSKGQLKKIYGKITGTEEIAASDVEGDKDGKGGKKEAPAAKKGDKAGEKKDGKSSTEAKPAKPAEKPEDKKK